jgi:uncharacterized protein
MFVKHESKQLMNQLLPYYLLQRAANGQFYFVLKAENHETILVSETYVAYSSALIGVASCRANSPLDQQYLRTTIATVWGLRWYFVLRAGNYEPIGQSELYSSNQGMESGISSCRCCGAIAVLIDQSQRAA